VALTGAADALQTTSDKVTFETNDELYAGTKDDSVLNPTSYF